MSKFKSEMEGAAGLSEGKRLAQKFNCLIELQRDLLKAEQKLGLCTDDDEDFESELRSKFAKENGRKISLGEMRTIRVAVAYQNGLRPSFVGSKDTPMEAALQVAAYLEGLSLETGPETIRKSIQRFRASIVGEELFRFDSQAMKWEAFNAEEVLLDGLPNRSGRPRKSEKLACPQ